MESDLWVCGSLTVEAHEARYNEYWIKDDAAQYTSKDFRCKFCCLAKKVNMQNA